MLIPDSPILIPDSLHSVSDETAAGAAPPTPMTAKDKVWTLGPALLGERSRSLLGKLVATHGEDLVAGVLADCAREQPGDAKPWVIAACAARQQPQPPGAGATDAMVDTMPKWARDAGFANRFEAENAGCTERNYRQFQDGRKVAA